MLREFAQYIVLHSECPGVLASCVPDQHGDASGCEVRQISRPGSPIAKDYFMFMAGIGMSELKMSH
jgi:hypothetical protein